ncbi:MAG: cation-translocating P-type ATPase [Oscillospiraceae bacterium]|nr:cation-translocating P-type ATPase [Oscillospiraceae bacterium]
MARRENEHRAEQGLTTAQAEKKLFEHGENLLQGGRRLHPMKILANQFKDFMIMILLAATVISVFMGETVEALTIVVIVLVNGILGFVQEFRTERTMEALKNLAAPGARVLRDGRPVQVPAAQVVPGDLLLLEAGDRVAADARLLEATSLQTDEAMLSGESAPVSKQAGESFVYMGTTVVKGRGRAVVTDTGMATEMGKIAGMLGEIEEEKTPLQQKLSGLGKYIGVGCLAICAVVTATGILRGEPVFDMLLTGISLAVAAIPEGLPAVVTIALALAVSRMLKRGALIRRLHAVETMGCAGVICSDKTGTLTENRMTVKEVFTLSHHLSVTGSGYEKGGELQEDGRRAALSSMEEVQRLFAAAVCCNNASLSGGEEDFGRDRAVNRSLGEWSVEGEPTEAALLIMAAKARVTAGSMAEQYRRTGEIPFDSVRKRMSVEVEARGGERLLFTKGAPDYILDSCTWCEEGGERRLLTPQMRKRILDANEEMAGKALRVLAFAWRPMAAGEKAEERELIFLGLTGMIDPPRKEAAPAVEKCRGAGIRPVMITGDHRATAAAIAAEIGILRPGGEVVTGAELDRMDDRELARRLERIAVFARVSPAHKLRIVRAFKARGQVVAMTGDGVNDAPAVKEADIGVSMAGGTDVTREAASVVLLDNSFATLVTAIEEGRVIYSNIRKFIRYLLSCNIGEIVTMFMGMLMGMPVVLLPIQILLINLATDGLPAIALGLEGPEPDVMERRPRRKSEGIFSGGLLTTILFRGALIGLTTLLVFTSFYRSTGDLACARTGAFAALVITQLIHVFECKSEEKGLFGIPVLNNWRLIGAVGVSAAVLAASIWLPSMNFIFRTVPLSGRQVAALLGCCAAVPVISSLVIPMKHRRRKKAEAEELFWNGELPQGEK